MKPPPLDGTIDPSLYARLAARLPIGVMGSAFYPFSSVGSTQECARRLAACGAPEGAVVAADNQTRGRGRFGRPWLSEPGMNLLISVLLRPRVPLVRLPQLSLMAAVASAGAILEVSRLEAGIRWPNDLLIGKRKVGGILSESAGGNGEIAYVVVGIGINVNQTAFPEELGGRVTSLALETGGPHDRERLCEALLASLDRWYRIFLGDGFLPVRAAWRSLSVTLGEEVNASGVTGRALDLDEDGALVVETRSGGEVRVLSGELQ
jgi:BirA family biotin operon repressor/biotin-[acetyl-CoA-carboxylase] ligase